LGKITAGGSRTVVLTFARTGRPSVAPMLNGQTSAVGVGPVTFGAHAPR
jgi:hypothetical protein